MKPWWIWLGTLLAALPIAVPLRAQPAAPVQTLAMVLPRDEQNIEAALREYIARRGLNVRWEVVRYSGRAEDQPALIRQLRALRPALIYTWGTPTTLAVAGAHDADPARHIMDIPVVFTEVTDPVGSRLVRQLDPPGRNVTGVPHVAPLPTQLSVLRAYRPFKRLGYIVNPAEVNTKLVRQALGAQAVAQGFEIVDAAVPLDARGAPDPAALPGLIRDLKARGADVLYVPPSTFLAFTHRDLVTDSALAAGLPTFCSTESIVRRARCLVGLFSNGANTGRFAGYKIAQVLAGGVPVERVPVQTLQRFSLLINMPAAQALDLYPPLALLNVAEVVAASAPPH
jgi:putative ABC transport system substrate-binding protein